MGAISNFLQKFAEIFESKDYMYIPSVNDDTVDK